MEVVRTEPEALTGCHWMVILTTKSVVYKNAFCHAENSHAPALTDRPYVASITGNGPLALSHLGFSDHPRHIYTPSTQNGLRGQMS